MIENIFENIKTEIDVAKLKRRIMREKYWADRIYAVRKKINNKVDADGQMPNNPELLKLYEELCASGELYIKNNTNKTENSNKEEIRESDDVPVNSDGSVITFNEDVAQILKRLKVRSNSGVAVVSLLTKPYTCPGRCIYCPTEKNMPKSYLSREPAAARALLNRFDPYKQINMRLKALVMNGHPVDKIEMIFIGGTFNFYKKDYQEHFTKEAFRACNNWRAKEEGREIIEENHNYTLEELQKINESSHARIIGLSIETRPDYIIAEELKWLRYLGVTKVELGVQHLNNKVLEFNKREMTAEQIAEGVELLRDYGFKIVYHMMPNLPTSDEKMDVKMFADLYNSKNHHPDMMKIYPNMVLKGSLLYKLVTQNKIDYKAYDDETLTRVLANAESFVPNYTRLIRVIRDIPADYIIIGSKKSNLREDVDKYQKVRGVKQVDIRAREIRDTKIDPEDFEMTETWYETEHGFECFLQFENKEKNLIAGFLRLRLPKNNLKINTPLKNRNIFSRILSNINILFSQAGVGLGREKYIYGERIDDKTKKNWGLDKWNMEAKDYYDNFTKNTDAGKIDEVLFGSALVRELHVYGTMKRVGEEGKQSQHTGMGKRLLQRAEEIARGDNKYFKKNKVNSFEKVAIIAGVGVREYYKKRGYDLRGTYMVKGIL